MVTGTASDGLILLTDGTLWKLYQLDGKNKWSRVKIPAFVNVESERYENTHAESVPF